MLTGDISRPYNGVETSVGDTAAALAYHVQSHDRRLVILVFQLISVHVNIVLESRVFCSCANTHIVMADLDASNLFNVKGLVAVVTGGGTGIAPLRRNSRMD